jgi:hypothetical protein
LGWTGAAGPCHAGWLAGKERGKGKGQLGSGCVGRWAGGPLGVLEEKFLDLNLNRLFKFKSHTIESNKFENPIPIKCINPSKPRPFTNFFKSTIFVKQIL